MMLYKCIIIILDSVYIDYVCYNYLNYKVIYFENKY